MPLRQNFPPIDVPRMLSNAFGSALRAAYKEQAPPKRGGRQIKIEGTVSGRKNQVEVSPSSIGAMLAVCVGNMLSYIARAS
jgi:hypothetical protein